MPTTSKAAALDVQEQTKLCKVCSNYNLALYTGDRRIPGYKHHATYRELKDAAEGGCELCDLLHRSFLQHAMSYGNTGVTGLYRWDDRDHLIAYHNSLDESKDTYYFYLSASTVVLMSVKGYDVAERINGLTYSRVMQSRSEGDVAETPVPAAWLSLSAVNGEVTGVVGRQLGSSWDVELCQHWLKTCFERHEKCRANVEAALPTRVIHIQDDSHGLYVKLVETANMTGQYATLSYCWGSSKPLSTTTENIGSHRDGMSLESLPELYVDALRVTKALGLEYLWIDSLCIVQDDEKDWQIQCAQMDTIYENSTITINAPGTSDARHGFLSERTTSLPSACELEIDWPGTRSTGVVRVSFAHDRRLEYLREEWDSPLNARAWIAQEYVLSPRILSFGTMQTYFTCNEALYCEALTCPTSQLVRLDMIGPQLEPDIPKTLFSQDIENVHDLWYTTINQYTRRNMTWGKDNLPALSGLARRFERLLQGDTYCAGLWQSDMLHGLSWEVQTHQDSARRYLHAPSIPPPSWSWAAVDFRVTFKPRYDYVALAQLKSVQCTPHGEDPFGEVETGTLSLSATLHPIEEIKVEIIRGLLISTIKTSNSYIHCSVNYDRNDATWTERKDTPWEEQMVNRRPIFMLPLWYQSTSPTDLRFFALVVERDRMNPQVLRRIGCIVVINSINPLENQDILSVLNKEDVETQIVTIY